MRTRDHFVLAAASLVAATTLTAAPAHATAQAQAAPAQAAAPGCPAPTRAEAQRSASGAIDRPPLGITGVRMRHLPKGFRYGQVTAGTRDGVREYGYRWSDDRDDVDRKHRSLWVRVICWPEAKSLASLRKGPWTSGTFGDEAKRARLGGRTVLAKAGDGALGHGRYVGWVERRGVVVTVMASRPLLPELGRIVKGIRVP